MTPAEAWERGYNIHALLPSTTLALIDAYVEGAKARALDNRSGTRTPNPHKEVKS